MHDVAQYLDSPGNQTDPSIGISLVDDSTTDGSGKLFGIWLKQDGQRACKDIMNNQQVVGRRYE